MQNMKFVDTQIASLKDKVIALVNCAMPFDKIVSIAETIQTTTELSILQQPPNEQKQLKSSIQNKFMQFQKSNHTLPPYVAPAQKKAYKLLWGLA